MSFKPGDRVVITTTKKGYPGTVFDASAPDGMVAVKPDPITEGFPIRVIPIAVEDLKAAK